LADSIELAERGYRVLRFWNNEILGNLDGVLETILGTRRATHLP
jgi:very-short-patch-repair endonuclease